MAAWASWCELNLTKAQPETTKIKADGVRAGKWIWVDKSESKFKFSI